MPIPCKLEGLDGGQVLSSEGGRPELLAPFYSFVLLLFFAYCYPIARFTVRLENKFVVIN